MLYIYHTTHCTNTHHSMLTKPMHTTLNTHTYSSSTQRGSTSGVPHLTLTHTPAVHSMALLREDHTALTPTHTLAMALLVSLLSIFVLYICVVYMNEWVWPCVSGCGRSLTSGCIYKICYAKFFVWYSQNLFSSYTCHHKSGKL